MTGFDPMARHAGIDWHAYFARLADDAQRLAAPAETVLLGFSGETSDFIRFNGGRIRQTGRVTQGRLSVRLIDGARQAHSALTVCGDPAADRRAPAPDGRRRADAARHVAATLSRPARRIGWLRQ